MDTIFGSLYATGAYNLRDHMLVHTLWDTGIREGELAALMPDDVDPHTCQIWVQYTKFGRWCNTDFRKETRKYLMSHLTLCRAPNLRFCLSALTD